MKRVTAAIVGVLLASPLLAQEPVTQEREHVVRTGDTLWDLAGFYFSNPFQWPSIYQANTMVVEDPHWIYPQEVLVIPGIAGDPREARETPGVPVTTETRRPARTVFYREPMIPAESRQQPTVLEEPELTDLPVRPGEFASAPYLADPGALQVQARFMSPVRDEDPDPVVSSAHPQDEVYLTYVRGVRPEVGQRLALVDVGEGIEGAASGYRVIHPKAVVRITELNEDVIQGQIEAQYGAVYPNRQRLVPMAMYPDFRVERAEPVVGGYDLQGRLLEFLEDQPMYGPAALAIIDLGRRDGVREGDVFEAFLPERAVRDRRAGELRARVESLPEQAVGELRVVRVTDEYATVKVDAVRMPRLQSDMPIRRVRRIP